MKISRLKIENFRGISDSVLHLPDHAVLIGDNNTGKSTILEALNLALGPDRLNRRPPIDEHDFFEGRYLAASAPKADNKQEPGPNLAAEAAEEETEQPIIRIEVVVTHLSDEQIAHFSDYIEWWNTTADTFLTVDEIDGLDIADAVPALRVAFNGRYDRNEDDFEGQTYFARSLEEAPDNPKKFGKRDKQLCGFLYLRALRTGSRALSLEHGSLLDIILRLKELRPQMWEETIQALSEFDVASNEELGISGVLESINAALKKYVPKEWGTAPRLKVSALTRDHLRKVITAFMATSEGGHIAPFYRQGTGTINMLVLALLSQIAEDKQNVMFAMEEPETAIPPYAQKRIVHELRSLSAQSIVTSHSPYVLEEYALDETVVLTRSEGGMLTQNPITLPESVKPKRYHREFRTRFCEGLLGRRVLVAEGQTEVDAMTAVARRLHSIEPEKYASLEALGITIVDAGSETQVGPLGGFYKQLGKTVFGVCDHQKPEDALAIELEVDHLFMHGEKGFEGLVLKNTTEAAMIRFLQSLDWPSHLMKTFPNPEDDPMNALAAYFAWSKGDASAAQFLAQCNITEIPQWLKDTCANLKLLCEPPADEPSSDEGEVAANDGGGD